MESNEVYDAVDYVSALWVGSIQSIRTHEKRKTTLHLPGVQSAVRQQHDRDRHQSAARMFGMR